MNTKLPRKISQIAVIGFLIILALLPKFNNDFTPNFEAYCPFGGLQSLGSYLLNQSLSCSMTTVQIAMGALLAVGVILFGKLFCSFICPVGSISEWLGNIGRKLKINFIIPEGIVDKLLRSLKYILLFVTLYFTLQSNELFCKKYDPYFGLASGYNSDVVLLYSLSALAIVIIGSMLIRQFWCKYICPLGAISNLFRCTLFNASVVIIYILTNKYLIEVHYQWPLLFACSGSYLIEIFEINAKIFPFFKVTRDVRTCTSCNKCTRACPQAIDVANIYQVRHIDCNLCGDCVAVCPEKETLQINKTNKLRWLPNIAIILLIGLGLFLGRQWELPTIDQRWIDFEDNAVEVYERAGLKNIKCYGSSMAFASKMRKVQGVYGVATYVKHKRVKIYYNPNITSSTTIEKELFTAQKAQIRTETTHTNMVEMRLTLENFFDTYDFNYLAKLLQKESKAITLVSEFGCPVIVKIYYMENEAPKIESLIELLETETLSYEVKGKTYTTELNYEVIDRPIKSQLSFGEYRKLLFKASDYSFNNASDYSDSVKAHVQINNEKNYNKVKSMKYLVSHLSNIDGIIGFKTQLNQENEELIIIEYIDSLTNELEINNQLRTDSLTFLYRSGQVSKIKNTFEF